MSGTTTCAGSHVNSVGQMDALGTGSVLVDKAGWPATKQENGTWLYMGVTTHRGDGWTAATALDRFGPYTVEVSK